jgi:hypothetical protein
MLGPDAMNILLLDEVKRVCERTLAQTTRRYSYMSKEDYDEERFYLDGQKYLADTIIRIIGRTDA